MTTFRYALVAFAALLLGVYLKSLFPSAMDLIDTYGILKFIAVGCWILVVYTAWESRRLDRGSVRPMLTRYEAETDPDRKLKIAKDFEDENGRRTLYSAFFVVLTAVIAVLVTLSAWF